VRFEEEREPSSAAAEPARKGGKARAEKMSPEASDRDCSKSCCSAQVEEATIAKGPVPDGQASAMARIQRDLSTLSSHRPGSRAAWALQEAELSGPHSRGLSHSRARRWG
jgi:hypothetical protein